MSKYRKKPVVIEAEQFTQDIFDLKRPNIEGVCWNPSHLTEPHVHTLEGPLKVSVGDFIITGIQGEKYPCKPDIFAATYEPVEDSQ